MAWLGRGICAGIGFPYKAGAPYCGSGSAFASGSGTGFGSGCGTAFAVAINAKANAHCISFGFYVSMFVEMARKNKVNRKKVFNLFTDKLFIIYTTNMKVM